MKLQSAAHSEETVFTVKTENDNLVFYFGDPVHTQDHLILQKVLLEHLNTHGVGPVAQVQAILGLDGKLTMKIRDPRCYADNS